MGTQEAPVCLSYSDSLLHTCLGESAVRGGRASTGIPPVCVDTPGFNAEHGEIALHKLPLLASVCTAFSLIVGYEKST